MYTIDELASELKQGVRGGDFAAVQETVRRAVAQPPLAVDPLKTQILHASPGLLMLHAVVSPGFVSPPHDHRTWAVIGVYNGQEDNSFYRLDVISRIIEPAGGKSINEREVMMLGPQGIHRIANPRTDALVALHIYGLNIFEIERSAWDPVTFTERPFDFKLDGADAIGGAKPSTSR